jgi:hypothetical protein
MFSKSKEKHYLFFSWKRHAKNKKLLIAIRTIWESKKS